MRREWGGLFATECKLRIRKERKPPPQIARGILQAIKTNSERKEAAKIRRSAVFSCVHHHYEEISNDDPVEIVCRGTKQLQCFQCQLVTGEIHPSSGIYAIQKSYVSIYKKHWCTHQLWAKEISKIFSTVSCAKCVYQERSIDLF